MKIIDLTQLIHPLMPIFPETDPPKFESANTLEKNGFIEKRITMFSHTGTHMDAPYHMLPNGLPLDKFPVQQFIGHAAVLDLTTINTCTISLDYIKQFYDQIVSAEYLLINTGWSRFWDNEKYFNNFPVLSVAAASWLAEFNLKGIGIDTISFDDINDYKFSVHHIFLTKGMVLIENLTNLAAIPDQPFIFSCLPLKINNADGSPVRAVALVL